MSRIDFHQHLWTDGVRRALEQRTAPPYLRAGRLALPRGGVHEVDPSAYEVEARLAELDRNGLDQAIVSLPPTTEPTPELVEIWHDETQQLERASGGRLLPLAYADVRPGYLGAIVSASVFADFERSKLLLTELARHEQLVFVHPGAAAPTSPEWHTAGVAYTQQMLHAYAWWLAHGARRWPELRVVFALLAGGAAFHVERFVRRGLDARDAFVSNVWFETSSYGERALELSLQTFGADRLVFGSDAPVDTVADARVAAVTFGEALEQQLVVSNPRILLGAEGHRWAA